jgi:hypothetical protein
MNDRNQRPAHAVSFYLSSIPPKGVDQTQSLAAREVDYFFVATESSRNSGKLVELKLPALETTLLDSRIDVARNENSVSL